VLGNDLKAVRHPVVDLHRVFRWVHTQEVNKEPSQLDSISTTLPFTITKDLPQAQNGRGYRWLSLQRGVRLLLLSGRESPTRLKHLLSNRCSEKVVWSELSCRTCWHMRLPTPQGALVKTKMVDKASKLLPDCWIGAPLNRLLNTLHSHPQVHPSTLTRKASVCSRCQSVQRPTLIKVKRTRQCGQLNPKWDICITPPPPPPPQLSNIGGEGVRKVVRGKNHRGLLHSVFWTWLGYCTHKLTVAVTACTPSSQVKFLQGFGGIAAAHASSGGTISGCWWLLEGTLEFFFLFLLLLFFSFLLLLLLFFSFLLLLLFFLPLIGQWMDLYSCNTDPGFSNVHMRLGGWTMVGGLDQTTFYLCIKFSNNKTFNSPPQIFIVAVQKKKSRCFYFQ